MARSSKAARLEAGATAAFDKAVSDLQEAGRLHGEAAEAGYARAADLRRAASEALAEADKHAGAGTAAFERAERIAALVA